MTTSNTIASERKRMGLTQTDLAEKLKCDRSTISRWEANPNNINGENIIQLSRFFGCSADYILGLTDERVPAARRMVTS